MDQALLNPTNWQLQSADEQLKSSTQTGKITDSSKVSFWRNSSQLISPLSIYKYLKVRYGKPNGLVMLFKNKSSDNLIHWQYSLRFSDNLINIWGKSSGIEISIRSLSGMDLNEEEWKILIANFQGEFKKYTKEMKNEQDQFEDWSLFINPFARIEYTLVDCIKQLEKLDLSEASYPADDSKPSFDKYQKELKRWVKNINKAASLGTIIRMLCPVMIESFINIILLIFRKEEYVNDERLYDNLIRQQIDIRVKSLHINCSCFPQQIDSNTPAFKNFHSLMNRRNDFLHGNVDPNKLIVERVWFDQKYIPLFEKDEGVIRKTLKNYCTNVEREKAIADFQTVSDLIELVLMSMDDKSMRLIVQFMDNRMPGINRKTKRLGVLFPSHLVENYSVDSL